MKALFGVGLRNVHFKYLEDNPKQDIDFFEIITENFFTTKGRPKTILEKIRANYPITCHGVSLSIASYSDFDLNYLKNLKIFFDEVQPVGVSDHLCFTGESNINTHNLLPFAFTKENLNNIKNRIDFVQNYLKRPMSFENLSAYISFSNSEMNEWEFISEIQKSTGANILLDLNNIYVNSFNHNFDPYVYLENIDLNKVSEIHLAGYSDRVQFYFDTHSKPAYPELFKLYEWVIKKRSNIPVLFEWDEDIPEFLVLKDEVNKFKRVWMENESKKI